MYTKNKELIYVPILGSHGRGWGGEPQRIPFSTPTQELNSTSNSSCSVGFAAKS